MARGGKKASASDDFASPPAAHGASKKRKSEALLKDLLGNTPDEGPVRACTCCCCCVAAACAEGARLRYFAECSSHPQLYSTPGEPARAVRPKVGDGPAAAGNLENSLMRALKEHSDRARERAKAQVQEELSAASALVDSELKALSHTLSSADEESAAARRQQLAQLAAEAAEARGAMDKALAAFKKLSADKLAVLQRVRTKVAALEAAGRPAPNKAECDKALAKLKSAVAAAGKRITAITDEAQNKNALKSALQSLVKSMDG